MLLVYKSSLTITIRIEYRGILLNGEKLTTEDRRSVVGRPPRLRRRPLWLPSPGESDLVVARLPYPGEDDPVFAFSAGEGNPNVFVFYSVEAGDW
nr:hypothetical protein Iba_chr02dCG7850 [Ipomoea batatas]